MERIAIDCGQCVARPIGCGACVVSALLGPISDEDLTFNVDEIAALNVLSASELLPPLRMEPLSLAAS